MCIAPASPKFSCYFCKNVESQNKVDVSTFQNVLGVEYQRSVIGSTWECFIFIGSSPQWVWVGWRAEWVLVITETQRVWRKITVYVLSSLFCMFFMVTEVHHSCQVCLDQPPQLHSFLMQEKVRVRKEYNHFLLLCVTAV